MKRRILLTIAVGVAAFSVVGGLAATLGGLSSSTLGADDAVVASCDSDGVSTSFRTRYDDVSDRYEVTDVTVSGLARACSGKSISVELTSGGNGIAAAAGVVPTLVNDAGSATVTFSDPPSAEAVDDIHVLISG